jgi:diaminohydroxyphosphoribosylaminopyrimidine deaminase / 5-amino-6-(5-phosphoribosylamino)uracil reductase
MQDSARNAIDDWADDWARVPQRLRAGLPLPEPWESRFGALRALPSVGCLTIGQLGQSLDGRIATEAGRAQFISGAQGLTHLHRLRALVDAVVVGAGTVRADNPQLTVRHCTGPCPVRVVIDPAGRLPPSARLFADDGVPRLAFVRRDATTPAARGVEAVRLPDKDGMFDPSDIIAALAARGLRRVLIEGGALTLSRFVAAGCLDRLHVVVAPLILGDGLSGLRLPLLDNRDAARRVPMRIHQLGEEVLLDCDLSGQSIQDLREPRA